MTTRTTTKTTATATTKTTSQPAIEPTRTRVSPARARLLSTASALFYREGIHAVGVDRIVADAEVTRATFYRHFPSKEDLVEAYLAEEDAFIRSAVAGVFEATDDPRARVELVIEGLADDVARNHTRGCPFINAAAEYPDPASPVRASIRAHREWFRGGLESLLADAGVTDAASSAAELVLLRDAAMVGGYLDGWEHVRGAFVSAARRAAMSEAPRTVEA